MAERDDSSTVSSFPSFLVTSIHRNGSMVLKRIAVLAAELYHLIPHLSPVVVDTDYMTGSYISKKQASGLNVSDFLD